MFAGHYAPAFATKTMKHPPSLGAGFLAVQLVDVLWAVFILIGVEHARVVPGHLAMSSLELYDMPWTHSLVMALAWSALAAIVYRLIDRRAGNAAALMIGALVFSHWLLDLLVHEPDLALYPGGPKLGLGWWGSPVLALGAELGLFAIGFAVYIARTKARTTVGRILPWISAGSMLVMLAFDKLGPPPADIRIAAPMAFVAYALFTALGFWLDRVRAPK
jgi:hypothetical protein